MNMKLKALTIAAAITLSLAWVPFAAGQAAPAASPPPTKLATINIGMVFEKLDEKNQFADEVDKLTKKLDDDIAARKDALNKQTNDLGNLLKPGTKDYNDAQEELVKGSVELQVKQQMRDRTVDIETRVRYAKLYKDVNDAIAAYAKANGIALVFGTDNPDLSASRSTEELFSRVASRKIMYADPSFDITQAVIDKMNADNRLGGQHH